MMRKFDHELSNSLAASARDLDSIPAHATERAQVRLLKRLRSLEPPMRPMTRRWLGVAAMTVVLVVAVGILPLFVGGGDAFAAMLERFRSFGTLSMTVTQRLDGKHLQTSHTMVTANGVLRTDVGTQLSIVVDPVHGRMLTLLHDARKAIQASLPISHVPPDAGLAWLEDLRQFKGKATPLPGSRVINGHAAHGWSLYVGGSTMEIWADADGLPLSMHMQGDTSLEIDYRFTFNQPIAAEQLSTDPPAGYEVVAADEGD